MLIQLFDELRRWILDSELRSSVDGVLKRIVRIKCSQQTIFCGSAVTCVIVYSMSWCGLWMFPISTFTSCAHLPTASWLAFYHKIIINYIRFKRNMLHRRWTVYWVDDEPTQYATAVRKHIISRIIIIIVWHFTIYMNNIIKAPLLNRYCHEQIQFYWKSSTRAFLRRLISYLHASIQLCACFSAFGTFHIPVLHLIWAKSTCKITIAKQQNNRFLSLQFLIT